MKDVEVKLAPYP
jgi:ribonuclease HI